MRRGFNRHRRGKYTPYDDSKPSVPFNINKKSYTHFISIPLIYSKSFSTQFNNLKKTIKENYEPYTYKIFERTEKIHLTLCMLTLDSPLAMAKASEIF